MPMIINVDQSLIPGLDTPAQIYRAVTDLEQLLDEVAKGNIPTAVEDENGNPIPCKPFPVVFKEDFQNGSPPWETQSQTNAGQGAFFNPWANY